MSPTLCAAMIVLLEGLGIASIFPVIHEYVAQFAARESWVDQKLWVGGLLACVALPKVILSPIWGHMSDRVGRRPILALVTIGGIVGSSMWALAPRIGFAFLIGSRVIVGVFGAQAGLAYSIIADVTTPESRAGRMAILGASFGLAITLGPIFGGLIGFNAGFQAIGWWYAGLQCVSLTIILAMLRETRPTVEGATDPTQTRRAAPLTASAWLILGATLAATIGMSELTSTLGEVTKQVFSFDARKVGYAFGFFGFIAALAQGAVRRLSQRFGEKALSTLGIGLCAAGFAILALKPGITVFFVAVSLIAVGSALNVTGLTTLISHAVAASEQGRAIGMNQSATGLGRAVGFFLGSGLLTYGTQAPYAVAAGMMILAMLLLAPLSRARDPNAA
ncbi:MAG: MFS transporter [Phycisphaerales bacterium]|nr:MFS transporter [Phycisphaerales bacterium]